jgi:hypothetical protein
VSSGCLLDRLIDVNKLAVCRRQVYLLLVLSVAYVAGYVEVVTLGNDPLHVDSFRVAVFFATIPIGVYDFVDVLFRQDILPLAFLKSTCPSVLQQPTKLWLAIFCSFTLEH